MPILTYKITKLVPIRLSRNEVETNTGWSNSSSTLLNGVQRVHNDGSSSNINAAITEAMTLIDGSKYDAYRIVVITHSDISVANYLWDYNWDETDARVNIVNLGPRNVMQYVENFTHHTGGDVYNAISASDLTYQVGDVVYTPPKFIGEHSDEDGIPDIVELYGLKPNGQLIGTDPKLNDTDGDGLADNVELRYIGDKLTMDLTKEQYDFVISCGSDPTKPDTDEDGINDYDETIGVSYNNLNGTVDEYEGDPLNKGLANGIVGKLTMIASHSGGFWKGHAFLLYESYINDTLDFSGFARGFKFEDDDDGNSKNNWEETDVGEYKISPNRVISIGNYASDENGLADLSGASGSGSSGGGSSGQSSTEGAASGIHFNMELTLLYNSENGDADGSYIRSYGDNAAVSRDISHKQLKKMLKYCNDVNHYNFIGNNCSEIVGKSWDAAFNKDIDFRIWIGTPSPQALKKTIQDMDGNFSIRFHDDRWSEFLNKEVVIWS